MGRKSNCVDKRFLLSSLLDYAVCYDSNVSLLIRACLIVGVIRVVTSALTSCSLANNYSLLIRK